MRLSISIRITAFLILMAGPALADFTDEFNDGVIDSAYWNHGGMITESAGLLNLDRESPADFITFKPQLSGDWTIEIEIRLNNIVWNDYSHGISLTDTLGVGISFSFTIYGKLRLSLHNGGSGYYYGETGSNFPGHWQTWTFQKTGRYLTIAVNGEPIGFGPVPIEFPDVVYARLPGNYKDGDSGAVGVTSSSVNRFVFQEQDAVGPEPWSWIDCTVGMPATPNGVAVVGDFAYVADSGSGLHVIDISDPTASQTVGIAYLSSTTMEVAVAGDFAYMAEFDLLSVVNISNPANPVQVGYAMTAGKPTGVAVSGNYALVANTFDFQVVDISDPTTPLLVGNIAPEIILEGWAYGVAISGNYAFVAGIEGLIVIDITNPQDPIVVNTLDFGGGANEITISGSIAYVCAGDLLVIDISDPVNPQVVGQVNTPGTALGVSVSGNLAYVGDYTSGLQIVDVSDPFNPQLLGGLATPGVASDLCVSGDFVYVADGSYGIQIIQVSNDLGLDCNSNDILDVFEMADHPSLDWNDDGTIDNCQQGAGVADVPSDTADRIKLHDAWPNPFNPRTTIAFDLPRQTQATLRVYDLNGRLVRTLLNGTTAKQGRNEIVWNGRDEAERRVSSGVYYYVLDAGEFVDSKRMVLIK